MAEPEKQFRVGSVIASIYRNTGQSASGLRTYKTVRLHREFRDRYRQLHTSSWLNANDVPRAMLALHRAFEHLMSEATDEESQRKLGYVEGHPFRKEGNTENRPGDQAANTEQDNAERS